MFDSSLSPSSSTFLHCLRPLLPTSPPLLLLQPSDTQYRSSGCLPGSWLMSSLSQWGALESPQRQLLEGLLEAEAPGRLCAAWERSSALPSSRRPRGSLLVAATFVSCVGRDP